MVPERASWNIKGPCCSLHFHATICDSVHGLLQCRICPVAVVPTLSDCLSGTLHSLGDLGMCRRTSSHRCLGATLCTASVIVALSDMQSLHCRSRPSPRPCSLDSPVHHVVEIVIASAVDRRRLLVNVATALVRVHMDVACRVACIRRHPQRLTDTPRPRMRRPAHSLAYTSRAYSAHLPLYTTSRISEEFELPRLAS